MKGLIEKIICLVESIITTIILTIFAIPLAILGYYFMKYTLLLAVFLLYKII